MQNSLISVIVPVYNVEQYLDRCIKSIVLQTYSRIEIILINDGSTDNCLSICNSWSVKDNRIIVIDQQNAGLSAARNIGIEASKGEWILFVDSDDYIPNNAIEKYVNQIKDGVGVIEGNTRFLSSSQFDNYDTTFFRRPRVIKGNQLFENFYYRKNLISAWNKLIRKDIVVNSLFPTNRIGEDVKFVLDMSIYMEKNSLNLVQIPDILYFYTINPHGIMQSRTARLRLDSRYLVYEEATKYFELFGHLKSRIIYLDMWEEILSIKKEFDNKCSCLFRREDLRQEWYVFENNLPIEKFKLAKGFLEIWMVEKKIQYKLKSVVSKINEHTLILAKRVYLCYCRRFLKYNV